ncbi:MAG: hypothetical protein LBO72_10330 [Helicobacteraceae bacterium]|jgi:hypothetical protein|nr:hypothetical protein [Helicobacteraceae bacterium]
MRALISFIFLVTIAFNCSGDCVSCHATLEGKTGKDGDHNVLLKCVECHQEIASQNAECGGNCFVCHSESSIDKSVAEHKTLGDCKSCHISASSADSFNGFFNLNDTLEDKLNRAVKPPK